MTEKRQNLDASTSDRSGLAGFIETALRRFRTVVPMCLISLIYVFAIMGMGLAIVPGIYFIRFVAEFSYTWPEFLRFFALGNLFRFSFFSLWIFFAIYHSYSQFFASHSFKTLAWRLFFSRSHSLVHSQRSYLYHALYFRQIHDTYSA